VLHRFQERLEKSHYSAGKTMRRSHFTERMRLKNSLILPILDNCKLNLEAIHLSARYLAILDCKISSRLFAQFPAHSKK
jgi:hypothetical protein